MTTYEYQTTPGESLNYEWTDLQGNILIVPDYTWDPILKDDKGRKLREYLIQEGYDGPGDWNPR